MLVQIPSAVTAGKLSARRYFYFEYAKRVSEWAFSKARQRLRSAVRKSTAFAGSVIRWSRATSVASQSFIAGRKRGSYAAHSRTHSAFDRAAQMTAPQRFDAFGNKFFKSQTKNGSAGQSPRSR
jgi:hypothetical protein